MSKEIYKKKSIYAIAVDPVYVGTGGYTIGRVDNTIVRDPITRMPKIPGSSVAGTWRYYTTLKLVSTVKEYQPDLNVIKGNSIGKSLSDKLKDTKWGDDFENNKDVKGWYKFDGNKIASINCAGQDVGSNLKSDEVVERESNKRGHCGHCIVCKSFGYSKADHSWQGMLFFSDWNILFFPVFTRFGTKWITSERILREAGLLSEEKNKSSEGGKYEVIISSDKIEQSEEYINLGWLNLPYKKEHIGVDFDKLDFGGEKGAKEDIKNNLVLVPDNLISQVVNSNLEVRTSVSIDPITGAAREKALFTSEAIPRGTIFYGTVRILDKEQFKPDNESDLPKVNDILDALDDSKVYYELFGIGGMVTRGFGRVKVLTNLSEQKDKNSNGGASNGG